MEFLSVHLSVGFTLLQCIEWFYLKDPVAPGPGRWQHLPKKEREDRPVRQTKLSHLVSSSSHWRPVNYACVLYNRRQTKGKITAYKIWRCFFCSLLERWNFWSHTQQKQRGCSVLRWREGLDHVRATLHEASHWGCTSCCVWEEKISK